MTYTHLCFAALPDIQVNLSERHSFTQLRKKALREGRTRLSSTVKMEVQVKANTSEYINERICVNSGK